MWNLQITLYIPWNPCYNVKFVDLRLFATIVIHIYSLDCVICATCHTLVCMRVGNMQVKVSLGYISGVHAL